MTSYLKQICIILGFTYAGELLQALIPLPIPAAVYGLVLLFLALCAGIVKPEQVRSVSGFLISILSILFVAPSVGIVMYWDLIKGQLIPILLLVCGTTVTTFAISGKTAQRLLQKKEGEADA